MEAPETLIEAIQYFGDPDKALKFFAAVRWPSGVVCPHCGSRGAKFFANERLWKCNNVHPRRKFSAKVGTIFEDSPIGLDKWLPAMWLAANCKNGISSYELHRGLGVTQKTAWFMLQRIRLAMHRGSIDKISGTCEADETFIGAKARNMHWNKRIEKIKGTGGMGKAAVQAFLQRGKGNAVSRVILKVVPNRRRPELCGNVREYVLKGSTLCTDALPAYDDLDRDYDRKVIDHAVSYAQGRVHTNGLENFWSLLKRALKGTYVNVEPFHLFRYLDEQAFRYNNRKDEDGDKGRFMLALQGVVGKSLKYAKLIAAEGGDGPCPTETWQTT